MRVFVTGATGLVGSAVVLRLREHHELVACSRSVESDRIIEALGAEPVRANIQRLRARHLAGCDAVIHAAALLGWGSDQRFWEVNVSGTENVLRAARVAKVGRFVFLGSEAVLFHGQHLRNVDESYPYPRSTPFAYAQTKAEAERRVLDANDPHSGFVTLSIRPRMVWGPGDRHLLPSLTDAVRSGRFRWIDHGRSATSTTHAHNVAAAVDLGLTQGMPGSAYFVSDDHTTTIRDFFTRLLATQGLTPPDRSVPGWLVEMPAAMAETGSRLAGARSRPPVTRFEVAIVRRDGTVNIDRARRELGYRPVIGLEEGLAELGSVLEEA